MKLKKITSVIVTLVLVLSLFSLCAFNASAEQETQRYTLHTGDIDNNHLGYTFVYVMKNGENYYALGKALGRHESVPAIDVTEYYKDGGFENIPDNIGVAFLNYRYALEDEYVTDGSFFVDGENKLLAYIPREIDRTAEYIGEVIFGRDMGQSMYYSYDEETEKGVFCAITSFYDSDNGYKWTVNSGTLALKSNGDDFEFALKNTSDDETGDLEIYMYAMPCKHESVIHSPLKPGTCLEKGCMEYWECQVCKKYFIKEDFSQYSDFLPITSSTGHKYNATECENCGRATPVYQKVTSLESMALQPEDTTYIIVAELNGKTYVVGMPDTTFVLDGNEDGIIDAFDVDDNHNGVPDLAERDDDEDGIFDYLNYDYDEDGEISDEEMGYYIDELIWNMPSNDRWAYFRELKTIEISKNADGTISVLNKDALEFYTERVYTDEEAQDQYGYPDDGIATFKDFTNDMNFYMPNLSFKPMGFIDNRNSGGEEDVGDGESGNWGVLFGKDVKEFTEFKNNVENVDDDHVLIFKEQFDSINDVYDLNTFIRLREYENEEGENVITFCVGYNYDIPGAEYDENFASGYNTFDKQYAVYLYASAPDTVIEEKEPHEHIYGDWQPTPQGYNHKRECTVEGCDEIDIRTHNWKDEYIDNLDNETHNIICEDCGYVEKIGHESGRYWEDNGDGVYHVKRCEYCNGVCNKAKHEWSEWIKGGEDLHYRVCESYGCPAEQRVYGCIPEDTPIERIKEPTCTEDGIAKYACITHSCLAIEKPIPAIGHSWGEWEVVTPASEGVNGLERRTCLYDPNHVEERIIFAHEHTFGEWISADKNCHYRECTDENCQKIEEEKHVLIGKVIKMPTLIEEGEKEFSCSCGYKETQTMARIVPVEKVENSEAKIKIEATDQTVATIDEKTELVVETVESEEKKEIEYEAKENIQVVAGQKAKIVDAYDISLMLQGVEVQPGGNVKVTIPAISNSEDYTDVKVVHIADDGTVTECETVINEDGTLTFITDHFSCYAIVATPLKTTELGDVNGDGNVDTTDLAMLKLYLAGLTDLSEISMDGADINADGGIDTTDLASLKLKLAGL